LAHSSLLSEKGIRLSKICENIHRKKGWKGTASAVPQARN